MVSRQILAHHETLGIQHPSSVKKVIAAYKRLAKTEHPDVHPNERPKYEEIFRRINLARTALETHYKKIESKATWPRANRSKGSRSTGGLKQDEAAKTAYWNPYFSDPLIARNPHRMIEAMVRCGLITDAHVDKLVEHFFEGKSMKLKQFNSGDERPRHTMHYGPFFKLPREDQHLINYLARIGLLLHDQHDPPQGSFETEGYSVNNWAVEAIREYVKRRKLQLKGARTRIRASLPGQK